MSVARDIAQHYFHDAVDFSKRFDKLWESAGLMHKMGRTKSFIDLLMGCECALKAHGFLSRLDDDPSQTYAHLKGHGHKIDALAKYANLDEDRSSYTFLAEHLGGLPVGLRYSLDAYDEFFPWFAEEGEGRNYSALVGNNALVLEIRGHLAKLIESAKPHLTGHVSFSFEDQFEHAQKMKAFMANVRRRSR